MDQVEGLVHEEQRDTDQLTWKLMLCNWAWPPLPLFPSSPRGIFNDDTRLNPAHTRQERRPRVRPGSADVTTGLFS